MFSSIFHAGTFNAVSCAEALVSALAMGLLIASLYRFTADSSSDYIIMLAVMPMLVCSVIMIVNGNLGASVAVLGAFGLVRFRSAPGTAKEIGYLFFAMAIGLASGMGFLTLAVLIAVLTSIVLACLEMTGFDQVRIRRKQLKITIPEDLNYTGVFDDLLMAYTKRPQLISVRTTNLGTMYELNYQIEMRDPEKEKEFLDAIRCRNGNLNIMIGAIQKERNVM